MSDLGYDTTYVFEDYLSGNPADLGNYVANQIIGYGQTDGANEAQDYALIEYADPVNPPLRFDSPLQYFPTAGPEPLANPPLPRRCPSTNPETLSVRTARYPSLGAEWGRVTPFAMDDSDRSIADPTFQFGIDYVFHDPGPAAHVHPLPHPGHRPAGRIPLEFRDRPEVERPPGPDRWRSLGHQPRRPREPDRALPYFFCGIPGFLPQGGRHGRRRWATPSTPSPANPTRPTSSPAAITPAYWRNSGPTAPPATTPGLGHWFDIFNGVMDHPLFERRLNGQGEELPALEYEVKAYLALGGAMHDAAITAWSVKGAYDYIRPISAIRWLAKNGQITAPDGLNYDNDGYGLQLDPGYIEPLDAPGEIQNRPTLAKVQAWAWVGPEAIDDPLTDVAGVGWINPTLWYPYQRPTFVTPNFAGYVSGHSTFSSAAAYVLEELTGTPYFPGGVGEFVARKDEFLVFEKGPSVDVTLQWATYRDASDQTSLSRIWGGIHPPVDDIPGRRMGILVGTDAAAKAFALFAEDAVSFDEDPISDALRIFPNPTAKGGTINIALPDGFRENIRVLDMLGRPVAELVAGGRPLLQLPTADWPAGVYVLTTPGPHAGPRCSALTPRQEPYVSVWAARHG